MNVGGLFGAKRMGTMDVICVCIALLKGSLGGISHRDEPGIVASGYPDSGVRFSPEGQRKRSYLSSTSKKNTKIP